MNVYFDAGLGEDGEWVAVSDLSGREYFGQTGADAESRCQDDDEHWKKNHKGRQR
jgi:hypothetical protein